MTKPKKIAAADCETDPFLHERDPFPFMWGFYDGSTYRKFDTTEEFVEFVKPKRIILYMHNGGKFDFMYLLKFLGETKTQIINGRIVAMFLGLCELRDSYAAVPESMKKIQKKDIEMWKLEKNVRHRHMDEIVEYNKWDCIYLYDLMLEYRKIAGHHKTIASNALSFAKKLGIDTGKTCHSFDREFREFFYGGRTEVFQPGTHNNVTILDIRSAYPFAMLHDHPTSSDWTWRNNFDGMTHDEINRSMVVLECFSHGALPLKKTGTGGGLLFPNDYNRYSVTGWEYNTAMEFGLLEDVKILSVRRTQHTISFKDYVKHWFDYKNSYSKHDFPIQYTIGKIMMNSLYGKLAQNPARYCDYKIVMAGTKVCYNTGNFTAKDICPECGKPSGDHGWTLHMEYEGHEIHCRESLWKYKFELGVEWQKKNIFYNVATGASITGFTRAHLLRAIHTIGRQHVIYTDTDSVICGPGADIHRLPLSNAIGDWDIEDENAPIGHFAGKKLYGVKLSTGKEKIASKGSRLTFDHIERIINGETVRWKNDAPSFSIDGSIKYVVRNIKATAFSPSDKQTEIA